MGHKNAVVNFFFPQFLMKNSWINYSLMGPVHAISEYQILMEKNALSPSYADNSIFSGTCVLFKS